MLEDLKFLADNFKYKSDGKLDNWRIMPLDDLKGDCDDYAVTALYLACDRNIIDFWIKVLTLQAIFWHTKSPAGGGHLVLWLKDYGYIDNWQKEWTSKEIMLDEGYKFIFPWLFPLCGLKMLFGVILRLFK